MLKSKIIGGLATDIQKIFTKGKEEEKTRTLIEVVDFLKNEKTLEEFSKFIDFNELRERAEKNITHGFDKDSIKAFKNKHRELLKLENLLIKTEIMAFKKILLEN